MARRDHIWAGAETLPQTGEGFTSQRGVSLAWRAYGTGSPLLMIAGLGGSGRTSHRLIPHLARSHRLIVFDNRGTGDSASSEGAWTMADLADDALAVLDAAGVASAHVGGASMGGMIAQHLAAAAPERVRSLILCCTAAHGRRVSAAACWRALLATAVRPAVGRERSLRVLAPLLYSKRTRADRRDRLDEDLQVRIDEATPVATIRRQLAAVARHDARELLRRIRTPALVVHGGDDRLVPVEAAYELARRIRHAQLVVLERAGHVVPTDAENELVAVLASFLRMVDAGEWPASHDDVEGARGVKARGSLSSSGVAAPAAAPAA